MKAQELRIGNIVREDMRNINYKKGNFIVTSVGEGGIELSGGYDGEVNTHFLYNEIEGIPLSLDWLIKMGFAYHKSPSIEGQDMWAGMGVISKDGEWLFRGSHTHLHLISYFNCQCKYVHELQNLFLAVFNKEITFKDPIPVHYQR